MMDTRLMERLLFEDESTFLDFKKQQYPFAKATEEEKSELLKDVLGFSNAWRRTDSYILIGIEQVRGDRANVLGIPTSEHLDDHSLQQFVNNLTNKPIQFHYEAFGFDGKQVGVIFIERDQARPLYLKRNYGKLKKDEVYVRRGSSTDPTKPASIDEIARMGATTQPENAELIVEFSEIDRDDSLGNTILWNADLYETPEDSDMPDYSTDSEGSDFQLIRNLHNPLQSPNANYYRELAYHRFITALFKPVRFVIRNSGLVAAKGVRLEAVVEKSAGVFLMKSSAIPDVPKKEIDSFSELRSKIKFDSLGDAKISSNETRHRLEIECGDLQPGRRIWSSEFYLGITQSGEFHLVGEILADNLPQPKTFDLTVTATIACKKLTIADLRTIAKVKDG